MTDNIRINLCRVSTRGINVINRLNRPVIIIAFLRLPKATSASATTCSVVCIITAGSV